MAYTPPAGSPAALGQHPRLHFTAADIPTLRNKFTSTSPNSGYRTKYQSIVNHLDSLIATPNSSWLGLADGIITDQYALVAIIGTVPGITYGNSFTAYGQKAIADAVAYCAATPPTTLIPASSGKHEYHYEETEYKFALVYDWAHSFATSIQRDAIANWLIDVGLRILAVPSKGLAIGGAPDNLWSSNHLEAYFPWSLGLVTYGDSIRTADVQTVINSWETANLNGRWIDCDNWIARDTGGDAEEGHYNGLHWIRFMANIDAWRTATGENYFSAPSPKAAAAFKHWGRWVLYNRCPCNVSIPIQFSYPAGRGLDFSVEFRLQNRVMVNGNKWGDPDIAGLLLWTLEQVGGTTIFENHSNSLYRSRLYDTLLGDSGFSVTSKSPATLGLKVTQRFLGPGRICIRTGFGTNIQDTAVLISAPNKYLNGHGWTPTTIGADGRHGWALHKYGPLVIHNVASNREPLRRSTMKFMAPSVLLSDGGYKVQSGFPGGQDDLSDVENNPNADHSPIRNYYESADGRVVALRFDERNIFNSTRCTKHERYMTTFIASTRARNDFVVILDRMVVPDGTIQKRNQFNFAYAPSINGAGWAAIQSGYWDNFDGDTVTADSFNGGSSDPYNGSYPLAGSDGKVFILALLPGAGSRRFIRLGGPGHEFELDDGSRTVGSTDDQGSLSDYGAYYCGSYGVNIQNTASALNDTYLTVVQASKATPSPTQVSQVLINSVGSTAVGVHVKEDTDGNHVVMHANNFSGTGGATAAKISGLTYSIQAAAGVTHVIHDLDPAFSYNVLKDAAQIHGGLPLSDGILVFTSTSGTATYDIQSTSTVSGFQTTLTESLATQTSGVDSELKARSVIAVAWLPILPVEDGAIGINDSALMCGIFAGFVTASTVDNSVVATTESLQEVRIFQPVLTEQLQQITSTIQALSESLLTVTGLQVTLTESAGAQSLTDTENESRAVIAVAGLPILPVEDGTIDANDSALMCGVYLASTTTLEVSSSQTTLVESLAEVTASRASLVESIQYLSSTGETLIENLQTVLALSPTLTENLGALLVEGFGTTLTESLTTLIASRTTTTESLQRVEASLSTLVEHLQIVAAQVIPLTENTQTVSAARATLVESLLGSGLSDVDLVSDVRVELFLTRDITVDVFI